jgi:predicted dinucleotide-binding enzyme
MQIGIIGSGKIGATAARLFAQAGHQVAVANSRGPESLRDLVAAIGPNARAATVDEAADFGQVVLLAIPLKAYDALPAARLAGKVVIDATNYYPARDGQLDLGGPSSQFIARHLPGARVVKAFNTMYFQTLGSAGRPDTPLDERLAIFLAGDDAEAKATVARLIEAIGFAPVDTGSLAASERQQPGAAIYNKPMTAREARAALGGR